MSFPRKRESMHAATCLDPRFRGGDEKGIYSPFISLETFRGQTLHDGVPLKCSRAPEGCAWMRYLHSRARLATLSAY